MPILELGAAAILDQSEMVAEPAPVRTQLAPLEEEHAVLNMPVSLAEVVLLHLSPVRLDHQRPAGAERAAQVRRHTCLVRRIVEVAERGKQADRGVERRRAHECPHVLADELDVESLLPCPRGRLRQIAPRTVHAGHAVPATGELKRVPAHPAGEVEHARPRPRREQRERAIHLERGHRPPPRGEHRAGDGAPVLVLLVPRLRTLRAGGGRVHPCPSRQRRVPAPMGDTPLHRTSSADGGAVGAHHSAARPGGYPGQYDSSSHE